MKYTGMFFLLGCIVLAVGFHTKASNVVEAEKLMIKGPDGQMIQLGFDKKTPYIAFLTPKGKTTLRLEGGENPVVRLNNESEKTALKMAAVEGKGEIHVNDVSGENRLVLLGGRNPEFSIVNSKNQTVATLDAPSDPGYAQWKFTDGIFPRLLLQGGTTPGYFLKNDKNKTVASWTILSDGGAGLGLADVSGNAATILRGGLSPSVSFFTAQNEPLAAFGVIQNTPHLLISGPAGNEGILLHGGTPSSLVVVDESGKVKILISKHGVFQGKDELKDSPKKKEEKIFSFEDQKTLFPSDSFIR